MVVRKGRHFRIGDNMTNDMIGFIVLFGVIFWTVFGFTTLVTYDAWIESTANDIGKTITIVLLWPIPLTFMTIKFIGILISSICSIYCKIFH